MAFNDERVVRAVADSQIPVVTGIGHETDFTLSDFAADLRAPTPTAAAELCTPDQTELREQLSTLRSRLAYIMQSAASGAQIDLQELRHHLENLSPLWMVRGDRQRLDETILRLENAVQERTAYAPRGGAGVGRPPHSSEPVCRAQTRLHPGDQRTGCAGGQCGSGTRKTTSAYQIL